MTVRSTRSGQAYAEVIGDPVVQSKSPEIHRHWLARSGMEGDYRAHRVTADGLGDYFAARRDDPAWRGCNVTMPHKLTAIDHCDRLDPLAAVIGAVNLVVREEGELVGYNADAAGFLEPLRPLLGQRHYFRMARLLGTGGAARAIAVALAREGFVLVVAGRDRGKAERMLAGLGLGDDHHSTAIDQFAAPTDFSFDDREGCCDLIVNATPLGMRGFAPLSFDPTHAPPGSTFYDIVTDPVDTAFLQTARNAGFETVDGRAMLLGQAAISFEKLFGQTPDRSADAGLLERLA